jgi:hypothetical protein
MEQAPGSSLPVIRTMRFVLLLGVALSLGAQSAGAQLRPLDPLDWSVFDQDRTVSARIGAGVFHRQRASLAGTEGRLTELGNFSVVWRTGRVALEASGTVMRSFDDEAVFAEPVGGAETPDGAPRRDSGDYRVATAIRLTPADAAALVALRFGTRLPTTDNLVGLERDRTDFFGLISGRLRHGGLSLGAETGVGIHGSRDLEYEQVDAWLYTVTAGYQHVWLTPFITVTGHWDGLRGWQIRGNEDLRELRLGVRAGTQHWLQACVVRGLTDFSPHSGLLLSAGFAR